MAFKKFSTAAKLLASVSIFFAISFTAEQPAEAHNGEGNWPSHAVGSMSCAGKIVKAEPPRYVTAWKGRETDTVFWKPVLYRYNGSKYEQFKSLAEWPGYAYVTLYGFNPNTKPGWRNTSNDGRLNFTSFKSLPSGSYKILNQIHWVSTGATHTEWSPNSCAIK
ncbi:hypothetical protein AC739_09060 [Planococcus glaciei]|jgi:hypothetical protein|uniref:Uncharacterized protein n=1 Tax=Planococcus glaciei TaxID=459472 RepID=A0A1G8C2R5_9BACL|nr:hypothetical protein [Planococcus glaciei]KOF10492.1 hypothetical protein AC739_09060 [Planococcus glaciei]MBX0316406.1 hypothetical protein [Planococcus glaciei]QKX51201.1 hypothetical protein HF394_11690 [Planococcus glaciei]SDH39634.1 hypothetical protein SAMN04487975_104187 [Planococcus glaciei]